MSILPCVTFTTLVLSVTSSICTATLTLEVRQPPFLEDIAEAVLSDRYYLKESPIHLPCRATGTQPLSYQWLKDGKPFDTSSAGVIKHQSPNDGGITIRSAVLADQGAYRCVVNNTWGRALSPEYIKIMAQFDVNYGQKLSEKTVKLGDFVKLEPTLLRSAPSTTVSWLIQFSNLSPKPLVLNDRIIQDKTGALYITHVEESDGGRTFISHLYNSLLNARKDGDATRLILNQEGPVAPTKPVLLYPSPDEEHIVLLGDDLVLQCIFSGSAVQVVWEGPMVNRYNNAGNSITIHKVDSRAEGDYTCVGRNALGETRHIIHVDVQARPKFLTMYEPRAQIITEGEDAMFTCFTEAEPGPRVEWFVNGIPHSSLTSDVKARVKVSSVGTELTINNVDKDRDNMVVQCNASNIHGFAYANTALNVIERTKITMGLADILFDVNDDLVELLCNGTTDPGTPLLISWYKEDLPLSYYDNPRMIASKQWLILNMTGLGERDKMAYKGQYRCVLSNGLSSEQSLAIVSFNSSHISESIVGDPISPAWVLIASASAIVLVILVTIFIISITCHGRHGARYPVGDLERKHGLGMFVEVEEEGFHVYQRPTPTLARMESSLENTDDDIYGSTVSGSGGSCSTRSSSPFPTFPSRKSSTCSAHAHPRSYSTLQRQGRDFTPRRHSNPLTPIYTPNSLPQKKRMQLQLI